MKADAEINEFMIAYLAFKLPDDNKPFYYRCSVRYHTTLGDYEDCDFIFSPFNKSQNPILHLNFLESYISFDDLNFELIDSSDQETEYDDYFKQYMQVKDAFKNTALSKLVLSRLKQTEREDLSPSSLFKKLTLLHPAAFTYLLYIPGKMCWIGSSPEPVLEKKERGLLTTALAGTKALHGNLENISWDLKEREEQAYIVKYLDAAFLDHSISYTRSEPYTIAAGKLCHIRSDYYVSPNNDLSQLMEIIHPGPALSGYPKTLAENIIPKIEKHDRKYYTGFFGTTGRSHKLSFFANLRCMELTRQFAILYLGGGITEDSKPVLEWQETELKASTMLSALLEETQAVPNDNI